MYTSLIAVSISALPDDLHSKLDCPQKSKVSDRAFFKELQLLLWARKETASEHSSVVHLEISVQTQKSPAASLCQTPRVSVWTSEPAGRAQNVISKI